MNPGIRPAASVAVTDSPFDLDNAAAYSAWRERKLDGYPAGIEELIVEVGAPLQLRRAEHAAIEGLCRKANMAIYAGPTDGGPDGHLHMRYAARTPATLNGARTPSPGRQPKPWTPSWHHLPRLCSGQGCSTDRA